MSERRVVKRPLPPSVPTTGPDGFDDMPPEWREAARRRKAEAERVVFEPLPEPPPPPTPQPATSLVNCRDCGKELSRRAASCPHCGAPRNVRPQLIERTSKRHKGAMLFGVGAILFGVPVMLSGQLFGAILAMLGLAIYISARISSWWDHG